VSEKNTFKVRKSWDTAILALLFSVWVLASMTTDNFLSSINVSQIFSNSSEILIMGFAMVFLIITGEIDLSIASILALSSAMLGYSYAAGAPIWLAILIAMAVGTTVNEFPEFWTTWGFDTIGTSFIPQTLPVIIIFGLFFALLLHNTAFGRRTLAIGQSPEAARFAGINVVRHKIIVFTFTGFMSGVAGVIYTFRFSTAQADNGIGLELLVISACLLGGVSIFGGIGTMWGVVAGVLLASSVESWLTLQEINAQWRTIVTGILLLISVAAPVMVDKYKRARATSANKA